MEEGRGSCSNPSLAVDCTLSLGSTTTSRAGSPDQADLAWPLALRSDERRDPSGARTCEPDRSSELAAMSWGGSCDRSDPGPSLEYFPQVPETEGRVPSGGAARRDLTGAAAWPSSYRRVAFKQLAVDAGVRRSSNSKAALSSVIRSNRASARVAQPWRMASYLIPCSSIANVSEAKASAASPSPSQQCAIHDTGVDNSSTFARFCAHCGTSKTPLWRNGPSGPKSLCNACGIRFKKAGRRSAAATGSGSEAQLYPPTSPKASTSTSSKRKLATEVEVDQAQYCWEAFPPAVAKPRIKRSRAAGSLNVSGSCLTWQSLPRVDSSSRPSPALHLQAAAADQKKAPRRSSSHLQPPGSRFSSDEEEGAVLLMALSCGMVNA